MRHIVIVLAIAVLGVSTLSGCQESESNQIRRARLVANENMKLKKQLAEKDRQIEELNKQIEKIEAERAKDHDEFGEATIKTLQMVADSETENQALREEVEKLKEELKKLKAQ